MRIAYVTETYPPEINGVSLTVERAVQFLRARGHQVDLIRPLQPGELARDDANELRTAGLPLPMYPDLRFGLAFSWTLARRFQRSKPDLVHIATEGPLGRAAMMAARRRQIPVTTDFRTNFHVYSAYYRLGWLRPVIARYLREFHNRGRLTFVPSRTIQSQLAAEGFRRLEVIGRGVDTTLFSPTRRSRVLRAEWGMSGDDEHALLYVGRLAREKNVELALRAFEMVRYLRPRTRMIVVGDGPMRRELEKEFPAARFVGVRRGKDLADHYASADLFVFPSESETFGNVTLEALASGLGVIAFNSAAAADLVVHGDNGLVAAPGNESAFIGLVCRSVAMDADALAAMRARARESALHTAWDKVLGRFENRLAQTAFADVLEPRRRIAVA